MANIGVSTRIKRVKVRSYPLEQGFIEPILNKWKPQSMTNSSDDSTMIPTSDLLFARQPIFDDKKQLFAFELLYRDNDPNTAIFDDGDKATASLIVNYCGSILDDDDAPKVKIFINLTKSLLLSDSFFPLDPRRIVVEILEDTKVDDFLIERIKELKSRGYSFALDDYTFLPHFEPLLPLVDYIKIELLGLSSAELALKMKRFHQEVFSKLENKPILLAEKVEDQETYDLCELLGFDLFQGYFLEKPMPVYGRKIDNNSETALKIVSQLQNEEIDIDELSHSISRDTKLSYQILKIVNSPLCRLSRKVDSLHEAVVFMGLEQIKKWAMAMVLAGNSNQSKNLFLLLLTRARTCELVSEKMALERPEAYFTVGLFSGIDAVMLAEKSWLLKKLNLSPDTYHALLEFKGQKGDVLKLTIDLEHQNFDNLSKLDEATRAIYFQSHEEAINWANQLFKLL